MSIRQFSANVTASGDSDVLMIPRRYQSGTPGIIFCHGFANRVLATAQGGGTSILDPSQNPGHIALLHALEQRWPVYAGDYGGDTWGNSADTAAISNAYTQLQNLGCTSKVALIGFSMGHGSATAWAVANPTKVKCIVGIAPLCDTSSIYTSANWAWPSVEAAWSFSGDNTAMPSGAEVKTRAATLADIPWQAFYSTADTVVLPSTVTTFASGIGGTATVCSTTSAHGDGVVQAAPLTPLMQFLYQNLGSWTTIAG